jgi:accessory gene regulator B
MRMIRNSIINWLIKNSAISEENRELYEYAVYSAELLVLPVIMAIVIGWLSGSTVNGIMLIIPFMFLKKYSGGYHAKKLSICMIISTILLTAMIKMSICDIKPAYMYITTCIAFIVSPIQSDNKILNEKETRYYKKVVVMQLAAYSIIIICSSILNCMIVTKCICLGIILASLMQLPCIVTRRTSIR